METRIIVCGGVDFNDYDYLKNQMDRLTAYYENIRLVSGRARGADTLAERYAEEREIPIQVFPAKWKKYGKAAGPIRNKAMLEYAKEGTAVVAAFWDGQSRGTGNMIKQARAVGAECHIFSYRWESEGIKHAEGSGAI